MRLAKCPQCDRIIDLDEIEELNEDTVMGCGQKEGDLLPCESCPFKKDPIGCELLRIQKGLTKTTIADLHDTKSPTPL